jgi:Cu/Ag efflux protein CusF
MCSPMNRSWACTISVFLVILVGALISPVFAAARAQAQQPDQQNAIQKQVGAIKSIESNAVTITTDSGATATVNVQPTTKIVRVEPGQTDLKNAVPMDFKDLQIGDRIFVRWKASDTAQPVNAIGIIAMKRADVDAKQQHERDDWQKRSVGGLVTSVDPASKIISISVTAVGGKKSIAVNTTPKTVFRRYAPDSVKFDDAKPSSLDQVKSGDQVRALGTRSADGSTVDAEEIVTGSFRNIAGTINSIDVTANSITVMDLITKKPVVVKVSDQTQVRKLAPEVAQRIAFRLKAASVGATQANGSSTAPGAAAPSGSAPSGSSAPDQNAQQAGSQRGSGAGASGAGGANGRPGGGQADLQQILNRMPAASLSDFKKGDAVMAVSTEGTNSGGVTAITLVGGVETILDAAATSGSQMTLSPWSLGSSAMDAGGANP